MAIKNKHDRMNQLTAMLEAHPDGLRRAEIARRLGVHRSTVGRYIDQLSLNLPVWERESRIGLESIKSQNHDSGLDVYEGTFFLFLLKLYENELNIKNPHASSFIRKISGQYRNNAPVLYESLLQKAESLELDEKRYSKGYNDNFEKLTAAWIEGSALRINYLHKASGESCSCFYRPVEFFMNRERGQFQKAAVCGLCSRTGERCSLYLSDFSEIGTLNSEDAEPAGKSFCPVSEYGREGRPDFHDNNTEDHGMKEANHRIKNSLFMTSGLMDIVFADNHDPVVAEKIRGLQSRVDAIAEVHEQLTVNDGSGCVQLDSYLSKIVGKLVTALIPNPSKVEVKLKLDDIQLDAGKAVPLGMIISELLINSFKHVIKDKSSVISLTVTKTDGTVSVRYGDGENKAGLPNLKERTGLKLIDGFCTQLGCEITYRNKYIMLEFPA